MKKLASGFASVGTCVLRRAGIVKFPPPASFEVLKGCVIRLSLTVTCLLIAGITFAQQSYNFKEARKAARKNGVPSLVDTYEGTRVYFDPQIKQFLILDHFKHKYGDKTVVQLNYLYDRGLAAPNVIGITDRWLEKIATTEMIKVDRVSEPYKWKLRTGNLVAGTAIIGASAAAYMLTCSTKAEYDTKRTIGYVCAGTSLVGVIVVLTGLHREYSEGFNVGRNITVSDCGGGISISKKF